MKTINSMRLKISFREARNSRRQLVRVASGNVGEDKALKRLIKMTNYTGRN